MLNTKLYNHLDYHLSWQLFGKNVINKDGQISKMRILLGYVSYIK